METKNSKIKQLIKTGSSENIELAATLIQSNNIKIDWFPYKKLYLSLCQNKMLDNSD